MLVEEHIDGPEVTVNAFSVDGDVVPLTVTDRLTAEPPAFGVALAHVWPSEHDTAAAVDVARAAVQAVGIRNGPSYTQVRLGPHGPVVMEVAARLGGGHDAELCRAALGVDLNALAVEAALGGRARDETLQAARRALSGGAGPTAVRRSSSSCRPRGGSSRSKALPRPPPAPASSGCASTGGRGTSSVSCDAAQTAREPFSRRAPIVTRRSHGLAGRPTPYASGSMRTRRDTMLGFQPPAIGEEEVAAVAETLRSGWLTTGPRAALLEERLAGYLEAEHVLAVSSGTAAMHLALMALDVGPGDEVITSPITWPATANVIEHCGATPVFCDVREGDLNLDAALLPPLVTERTKAILPVHLAGQPCDLDPIHALGLPVVEDAAHALESRYRGRKLGGLSDAAAFSLYATKNLAAGEGGLVATNRGDVADRIRSMRLTRRGDGSLYDQVTAGFKANLSDVLAAIALVQLDRLESHAEIRARQFALYDDGLADLDGITPLARDPRDTHAMHLYAVRIDAERAGATRDLYQRELRDERISTSIHFLPVHRLTWFRERYPAQPPLPVAERAGDEVLSLPLSPAHSDDDIRDAIDAIRRVHDRLA